MVTFRKSSEKDRASLASRSASEVVLAAGDFKARCLKILDEVSATRHGVVITKRGRPVARVVPIEEEGAMASLKGSVVYEGDLVSPLGEVWSASS